ncbi:hypothetical protein VTK26DRAFT_194 [Humicola hyalothermophila]
MVSVRLALFAAFAALVSAAPPCPPSRTPTLPKVGGPTELPAPAPNLVLKKIAVGHGIQNYSCESATAEPGATGAVAVLYDATALHPQSGRTGLSPRAWDTLPETVLYRQPLPLNKLPGTQFGADPNKPFPTPPADLSVHGVPNIEFLGYHFFDGNGVPMFDLSAANLKASVVKTGEVSAPRNANQGILGTGAVAWLQLEDSDLGLSNGVSLVYRVITAGGKAQACSVVGPGVQSVPYATYYWFYG